MSRIELKEKLIKSINNTENDELLYEVYRLLEIVHVDLEIYKLSDSQKKAVIKGQQQIQSGKFIEDKQAN